METHRSRTPAIEDAAGLARARVLVAGIGGLGTPAALALAAAGVGRLVLIDPDVVEASNLHRQILYRTAAIGMAKVESARRALAAAYPTVAVEARRERLGTANLAALFAAVDFVIDATDGADTKYLINDGAVRAGRPYSHAGVLGWQGQTFTVVPGRTPCLRCLFPEPPQAGAVPRCEEAGIVGPLAGLIGNVQAAEAIRHLSGQPLAFAGRILTIDARVPRWRTVSFDTGARCTLCRTPRPAAPDVETLQMGVDA
jgi:molybdopterin/thiamine biosynthesis adenylyltransferase